MNRVLMLIAGAIAGSVLVAAAFAEQHRPYNEIMKDVASAFASLKKSLDANSAAAAAADAAKLQALFTETEAFWAPFETKDAMNFAKSARDAAAAVSAAAKNNNVKTAQSSYAVIQKNCANCHFAHREETGKGFLIKP